VKRRISALDVARAAGVSRTTVSFVLNNTPGKTIPEETRQRVLSATRTLGYTPNEKARSVAMVKHHSIGFFIPHAGYISSDAYIFRVIEGMTPALNKARFQLVLQPLKLQQMNYLQLARQNNVDGIILMNTHDADTGLAEVIDAGFPLVVIGTINRPEICQIDIDNRTSAAAAARHLVELGHRNIGMIAHAPFSYYAARDRREGFLAALADAGIPPREAWMRVANLTEESGYRAMQEILAADERPTAVFAGNDVVAYGAVQAVKDAGLSIPGDLSIVGFDDDLLSRYLNPPLTTITNPAAGLGAEAARLLVGILRGRTMAGPRIVLPTSLARRESCRSLRDR
jgi:LacI family transcriptional regulator